MNSTIGLIEIDAAIDPSSDGLFQDHEDATLEQFFARLTHRKVRLAFVESGSAPSLARRFGNLNAICRGSRIEANLPRLATELADRTAELLAQLEAARRSARN